MSDSVIIHKLKEAKKRFSFRELPAQVVPGVTKLSELVHMHDNATVTPHIGTMTDEAQSNIAALLFSYLEDAFSERRITTRIV